MSTQLRNKTLPSPSPSRTIGGLSDASPSRGGVVVNSSQGRIIPVSKEDIFNASARPNFGLSLTEGAALEKFPSTLIQVSITPPTLMSAQTIRPDQMPHVEPVRITIGRGGHVSMKLMHDTTANMTSMNNMNSSYHMNSSVMIVHGEESASPSRTLLTSSSSPLTVMTAPVTASGVNSLACHPRASPLRGGHQPSCAATVEPVATLSVATNPEKGELVVIVKLYSCSSEELMSQAAWCPPSAT